MKQELGGAMVWTIDLDDFNNMCCRGSYPLLTKVNEVFKRIPIKSSSSTCNKPDYPMTPAYQIPTTTEEGGEGLYLTFKMNLLLLRLLSQLFDVGHTTPT